MVVIPSQPVPTAEELQALLSSWYQLRNKLTEMRDSEAPLRRHVFGLFFPDAKEGTNRVDIGGGFDLVAKVSVTRNVDEPAVKAVKSAEFKRRKIDFDSLFVPKLALSVAEYRKLDADQREFVDSLLDIKHDGMPSLAIEAAKEEKDTPPEPRPTPAAPKPPAPAAPQVVTVHTDHAQCKIGDAYTDGAGNFWLLAQPPDDAPRFVPVTDPANVAALVASLHANAPAKPVIVSIEDPDKGQPGDYYEDGDKQWWHVDQAGEWHQCANPNGEAPPVKKRRGRKPKTAA